MNLDIFGFYEKAIRTEKQNHSLTSRIIIFVWDVYNKKCIIYLLVWQYVPVYIGWQEHLTPLCVSVQVPRWHGWSLQVTALKKYIIYQHECYFHENNTNIKNILLLVSKYIRFDSLKHTKQFYNPSCITHCALQTVLTYGIQCSSYPYIPVYNYRINCCNHGHSSSPLNMV